MHSVYEGMIAMVSIFEACLYDKVNASWRRAGCG